MNRLSIIHEIGDLTEQHCKKCPGNPARTNIRQDVNARVAVCLACPIDQQLKSLGNHLLDFTANKRKTKSIEVINDMGRTTKPGPVPGLTKDVYLEQRASGESVEGVGKAWGVKSHVMFYWVEKWGLKGVDSEKARTMVPIKSDTTLLRSSSPVAQAIEARAQGLPAINESRTDEQVKELSARLRERNVAFDNLLAENKKLHEEIENSIITGNRADNRIRELDDELAISKSAFNKQGERLVQAYDEINQLKQAVAELEEERSMLLPTIETATIVDQVNATCTSVTVPVDNVNSPAHYTQGGIETIDFIRAKLTPEEFAGYLRGNVIKYMSRAHLKGGKEDFSKASVYLKWLVDLEVGSFAKDA